MLHIHQLCTYFNFKNVKNPSPFVMVWIDDEARYLSYSHEEEARIIGNIQRAVAGCTPGCNSPAQSTKKETLINL